MARHPAAAAVNHVGATRSNARLDALAALIKAREARAQQLVNEWLRGRHLTLPFDDELGASECATDGWSLFIWGSECVATWAPGPRRLTDPDVVLVSGRRYESGSTGHHLRRAVWETCRDRGIPCVEVNPIYPAPWARDPNELMRAHASLVALQDLVAADGLQSAARTLVWDWWCGERGAILTAGGHFASVESSWICADRTCLLTWTADRRVALLNARRFQAGTFRRLLRDEIRVALQGYDLDLREIRPRPRDQHAAPEDLVEHWEYQEGQRAARVRLATE